MTVVMVMTSIIRKGERKRFQNCGGLKTPKSPLPLETGAGFGTALAPDVGLVEVFFAPTDLDLGSDAALAGFFEGTEKYAGVH